MLCIALAAVTAAAPPRADAALRAARRALPRRAIIGGALSTFALTSGIPVQAVEEPVTVYFGCGCFWHVQHEFVEAERKHLGRGDLEITSHAGYAGGKAGTDRGGKVCYHNAAGIGDYGRLGHAEVVQMKIPPSKFYDFAREYAKLFDKDGYRPDQWGDRGPEYRNLVGIPGGVDSPLAQELVRASKDEGDKLSFARGKGDDDDVRALSWIMDTKEYPFYIAEGYHQFHDGFKLGEDYPRAYNRLAAVQAKAGLFTDSGCPNGMIGLGVGGL